MVVKGGGEGVGGDLGDQRKAPALAFYNTSTGD